MPPHVVEAAAHAAERPAYAPTLGALDLREAIADRLSGELGWPVDPERNVLVTLGGMQALYLAAQCFGTRAVSHAPAFFFPQVVAATGGECALTGGADGPPDWDAFAAAVDAETTLAIVNTPVNPTGYVFRAHDLDAIAAALARTRRCCSPTRRTPGCCTTASSTSRPARTRSCASGRSCCAASRRPTRWPRGGSGSRSGPRTRSSRWPRRSRGRRSRSTASPRPQRWPR